MGLKVIWREQLDCGPDCGNSPPFNSTWQDLFSAPNMRLAENFPGPVLKRISVFDGTSILGVISATYASISINFRKAMIVSSELGSMSVSLSKDGQ